MNTNTFANYFVGLCLVLLIINYTICNHLYQYGLTGFITGLVISLVIDTTVLFGLTRVKIQDETGNVHSFSDVLLTTMSLGMIVLIMTVIFVVAMTAMNYRQGKKMMLPLLSSGMLIASLAVVAKVLDR